MSKEAGATVGGVIGLAASMLAAWGVHATGMYRSLPSDTGSLVVLAASLLIVCVGVGVLIGYAAGER